MGGNRYWPRVLTTLTLWAGHREKSVTGVLDKSSGRRWKKQVKGADTRDYSNESLANPLPRPWRLCAHRPDTGLIHRPVQWPARTSARRRNRSSRRAAHAAPADGGPQDDGRSSRRRAQPRAGQAASRGAAAVDRARPAQPAGHDRALHSEQGWHRAGAVPARHQRHQGARHARADPGVCDAPGRRRSQTGSHLSRRQCGKRAVHRRAAGVAGSTRAAR